MAIYKSKEIREMSPADRQKKLNELRLELAKANAQISIGSTPENLGRIGEVKRTIARIKTIEKEVE